MNMIRQLLNGIFSREPPNISREKAISLAKIECEKRGWPFLGVIKVQEKRRSWIVNTNWESRGSNVKLRVDKNTGEVIDAKFMPR